MYGSTFQFGSLLHYINKIPKQSNTIVLRLYTHIFLHTQIFIIYCIKCIWYFFCVCLIQSIIIKHCNKTSMFVAGTQWKSTKKKKKKTNWWNVLSFFLFYELNWKIERDKEREKFPKFRKSQNNTSRFILYFIS